MASSKSPKIWIVECPMIEGLGELAISDLSRTDEDDRTKAEIGRRAVDGQGRGGIARAGTGDAPRRNHASMCERGGHSIVFEAAGGIHALILQPQGTGIEADIFTYLIGTLEEGLTFADRDDLLGGCEREQLAEPPDSGEAEGIEAVGPLRLEIGEPAGDRQSIPLVDDVDQIAAKRTGEMSFVEGERRRASRVQALLKRRWSSTRRLWSRDVECCDICRVFPSAGQARCHGRRESIENAPAAAHPQARPWLHKRPVGPTSLTVPAIPAHRQAITSTIVR